MSKSIEVTIVNSTNKDLILKNAHLDEGRWDDRPFDIPDGSSGDFKAANTCEGVAGHVIWVIGKRCGELIISFEKPEHEGPTKFLVDCPDQFRYNLSGDALEDRARMRVELFEQS